MMFCPFEGLQEDFGNPTQAAEILVSATTTFAWVRLRNDCSEFASAHLLPWRNSRVSLLLADVERDDAIYETGNATNMQATCVGRSRC